MVVAFSIAISVFIISGISYLGKAREVLKGKYRILKKVHCTLSIILVISLVFISTSYFMFRAVFSVDTFDIRNVEAVYDLVSLEEYTIWSYIRIHIFHRIRK